MSQPTAHEPLEDAPASEPFAWGYFLAIVVGVVLMIAVICSIATLSKKAPAKFSLHERLDGLSLALV